MSNHEIRQLLCTVPTLCRCNVFLAMNKHGIIRGGPVLLILMDPSSYIVMGILLSILLFGFYYKAVTFNVLYVDSVICYRLEDLFIFIRSIHCPWESRVAWLTKALSDVLFCVRMVILRNIVNSLRGYYSFLRFNIISILDLHWNISNA